MTRHRYPRPQLRRETWMSLNGAWQFAIDRAGAWRTVADAAWDRTIEVPFAPETPASGVCKQGYFEACWYRRTFEAPALEDGERLILHFGAVDYEATVWMNGERVAQHEGGYTPFSADVTDVLYAGRPQEIVVRAKDDPHDLAQPRGKQDWAEQPHDIWYPRTTGIWQTVWIERAPAVRVEELRWTSDIERWEIGVAVRLTGNVEAARWLRVQLEHDGTLLADDTYSVDGAELARRIALDDPGIDAGRARLLWRPSQPTLIDARIELLDDGGAVVDRVESYTAMRSVGVDSGRFLLNGRPYRLRMALDQGYWPATGMTAPDDDALRRDVELAKAMGFNGVRKHQKVEDPRYLFWADVLGLLVWEEMPSAYRFTPRAVERTTRQWMEAVKRDVSHPCIIAWVPFNESWGVPDIATSTSQRVYVQALYSLTKALDESRPVVGNDGWEHVATDLATVHDYDGDAARLAARYGGRPPLSEVLARERPAGRALFVGDRGYEGQPVMLSEFGGIGYSDDADTWGYTRATSAQDLAERYRTLMEAVHSVPSLAGFCYTQFADTYQEVNGLLFADRRPKFPLEDMARIARGRRPRHANTQ